MKASAWESTLSRVRSALLRRGRSRHDAEDLVQEAWIRLAGYSQHRGVEKPEAFLMQVALNLSVDAYRATQARGEEVVLDDVALVDFTPSPDAVLLARERVARLSACLGRLTDRSQQIIIANRVEGLTYDEIAQRYGLSASTVEKHIAKALMQLTTCMDGW